MDKNSQKSNQDAAMIENLPTVLVVEDDIGLNHLIRKTLERDGFKTHPALNGAEAIAATKSMNGTVVLLDYLLPDMTGKQVVLALREEKKDVPIIIITGHGDERIAVDIMKLGVRDYIIKEPGFVDNLPKIIRQTMNAVAMEKELERTENALRQSEQKFRNYIERAPDGVFMVDDTGRYVEVNNAACRIIGHSREEILNMSVHDLIAEESSEDGLAHFKKVMETGAAMSDIWHKHKDGSNRCLTINAVKLSETKVLGFAKDITERKRAKMALLESEARYRAFFEASAEGILIADLETRIFKYANPSICRMLGYTENELITLGVADIHPKDALQGVIAEFEAQARGEKSLAEGLPCLRKDGAVFYADVNAVKIIIDGKACNAGFFRDITERKQAEAKREKLEEQLRMSQKMEAIGSLAGGIAHDFNNLLCVILGYTELAMKKMREEDPLKDKLQEIKNAGERAAILTRQLLAFSRKQILEPVPLDLNQVAAGIEKMLRRIIGEDIDFVSVLTPDLGVVRADPGQIEQVLMNLVVNARDAMRKGGRLTIETANAEIDEMHAALHLDMKPGSYVVLTVTDTGIGMDKQTKARLFEPFFTTKEKGKGTGLGLSTVYGIVKQSKGNIWVYSEPGQGTTFKIYLPRVLSGTKATVIKPRAVTKRSTGTETILVVEDEDALRRIVTKTLEETGYTVLNAADGEGGLITGARHVGDIQLLVTDVIMPHMNGWVLAQELKKTRPTLKVIYMSGYTDNAIVHDSELDQGIYFLGKPFTADSLTRKVREVLDNDITNLADEHGKTVKADAGMTEL
jgi:two-component system cell cycle sensor histidine kinase/response regulator CckA